MGLDIRELRIGNSVLYEGERVKIDQISQFGDIGLVDITHILVPPKDLSPIPITEELLKELGFDIRPFRYRLKAEKYLSEYDEFLMLERMKGEDKFDVYLYISKNETHRTYLKYLHELEQFVYLTTKQELI